jgi:hypothetical protein
MSLGRKSEGGGGVAPETSRLNEPMPGILQVFEGNQGFTDRKCILGKRNRRIPERGHEAPD